MKLFGCTNITLSKQRPYWRHACVATTSRECEVIWADGMIHYDSGTRAINNDKREAEKTLRNIVCSSACIHSLYVYARGMCTQIDDVSFYL